MLLAHDIPIPTFEELFEWPEIVPWVTKYVVIVILAAVIAFVFWFAAGRRQALVPKGVQSIGESLYQFIRNDIVVDVMGESKAALKYVPYLTTLFSFIFLCNVFEIIPPFFFPATSRLALPLVLALLTWFIFVIQGIVSQGVGHYFGGVLFPAGVPKPLYLLLTPIEFVSVFFVRPLTLMVRLFANLVAGHTIVTLMIVFTAANMDFADPIRLPIGVVSLAGGVAMFGFELFVSAIQAFVFTILTAVYIGESIHGH
ncbi:MAG: ATP synthase F0 subunit A [Actinobacteria bacterium ATB1]|nr:ATP synthase F0 subunit A [Actinobacteria bacterium ATB1]